MDHPAYLDECQLLIKESRDALFGMLQALAGNTEKIKSIQNTRSNFVYVEVADAAGVYHALQEQGIAIRLMGNYLRICAGSEEENAAVVQALDSYLKGAN